MVFAEWLVRIVARGGVITTSCFVGVRPLQLVRKHTRRIQFAMLQLSLRAFWAAMVAIHIPLTLSACGITGDGGFHLLRAAGLLACLLVFIGKLIDLPWLRLPADRRVWLAVALGVALLHAGVVAPDALASPIELITLQTLLFVFAAATIVNVVNLIQHRFESRTALARLRHALFRIAHAARDALLPPRDLRFAAIHSPVRPPPIC